MNITHCVLGSNPFIDAYMQADWMGKFIFLLLIALSIISWSLIVYKTYESKQARKKAKLFKQIFNQNKHNPLKIEIEQTNEFNPFCTLYLVLKQYAHEVLGKNKKFGQNSNGATHLSCEDIEFLEAHTASHLTRETQKLEHNLFILSTIVTLAPFLGLLGTVWGILTSFTHMQSAAGAASSQAVLGGLSLALATTVLGLLDAIPALIGYNYMKSRIRAFQAEMELFTSEMIAAIELQYRRVDECKKTDPL